MVRKLALGLFRINLTLGITTGRSFDLSEFTGMLSLVIPPPLNTTLYNVVVVGRYVEVDEYLSNNLPDYRRKRLFFSFLRISSQLYQTGMLINEKLKLEFIRLSNEQE